MSGIYIHIPFCKQACHYCDFHFSTSLQNKNTFLLALKKEIELRKDYLIGNKISTIYFGGGTPSLLSLKEISDIFDSLTNYFSIDADAEITLEANPDDLTKEKIKELKRTPINRLSIGIQSFFDEDLKLMNRVHDSAEAKASVKFAQEAGFKNITIDLIYGIPTLTNENWKKNIATAFSLNVQHISAYCLTVEPKTAFADFVKKGKIKNVDEQKSAEHFEIMIAEMKINGFYQYEISNFCKEGFYSRHNSSYWKQEHYLGLGPSAHSFDGVSRQWNIANNNSYTQSLKKNEILFEKEILTKEQRYNEYILTSLRTMWGTDLDYIKNNLGNDLLNYCLEEAKLYLLSGNLKQMENKLYLTDKGKLFADKIASDLFKVE